jgi:hypothetical protein
MRDFAVPLHEKGGWTISECPINTPTLVGVDWHPAVPLAAWGLSATPLSTLVKLDNRDLNPLPD